MNTISNIATTQILSKLHKEASSQMGTIMKGLLKSIVRPMRPSDMEEAYIAISKEQGDYIYDLLLKTKATNIVEFGTSFGISTIYLAAAAKANGGRVITTELLPSKVKVAAQNFKDAGLENYIDLREGDAMETLQNAPNDIDFLLLDGWNDLYLPLLKMLEPTLKKGAYIYTDNINFPGSKPHVAYLQSQPNKYKTEILSENKGGSALTQVLH